MSPLLRATVVINGADVSGGAAVGCARSVMVWQRRVTWDWELGAELERSSSRVSYSTRKSRPRLNNINLDTKPTGTSKDHALRTLRGSRMPWHPRAAFHGELGSGNSEETRATLSSSSGVRLAAAGCRLGGHDQIPGYAGRVVLAGEPRPTQPQRRA
jgi:hypothetical protein